MSIEGEVVAVVGRKAKHLTEENALSCLLGWTIGNDVSERNWQKADRTFWRAKNSDTFKPMGPWIETDDPVVGHPGERFLLVHSRKDRITDPRQTQRYAAELTDRGAHVDLRLVRDLHAMLLRPGRWHRAVARFAAAAIRDANSADRPN